MTKVKTLNRDGSVAVMLAILILPLLALTALAVDYGFLLYVKTDLQRSADQAAIAGVRDLVPDAFGNQDLVAVKASIRDYLEKNMGGFVIDDDDIEIGRYNPESIYSSLELLNDGVLDTVRITLRRDDLTNSSVSLYFARIFDKDTSDVMVTSCAVLQRARFLEPGTSVLPITIDVTAWSQLQFGDIASVYGDGRLEDPNGNSIPGNWGTVDIGARSNSTQGLREQIENGLTQDDLNSLHSQGAIPDPSHIDSQQESLILNGDTGFSSGMRHAITPAHGTRKLMPIYSQTEGQGGNLTFEIVGWGVVEIVDSGWNGNTNSYVEVRKSYTYEGDMTPANDLSDESVMIDAVFTSPVLIQ